MNIATSNVLGGRAVDATAPTDQHVLTWVASTSRWTPQAAAGGVTLAVPGVIFVSPVSGSGTNSLTLALKTQVANTALMGPTTGADATPTFRALVAADLPSGDPLTQYLLLAGRAGGQVVTTTAAGSSPLAIQGIASQTAALIPLRGQSSTTAGRNMAAIDATFSTSTDASRLGRLSLYVADFNSGTFPTGWKEGLRIDTDGTTPTVRLPSSALAFGSSLTATTGNIRLTQTALCVHRNNANTADLRVFETGKFQGSADADSVTFGGGSCQKMSFQTVNDLSFTCGKFGVFGAAAVAKPTITGSRGANAALASLLTALASLGLITDSTTA